MKYRKLGNSGIDVSVIAQGTWAMGNDFFGEVEEERAIACIHASMESGVNLIDTAAAYGEDGASEKVVGKALLGRRDKAVLATKLGVLRVQGSYVKCCDLNVMRYELEQSLRRLQTDYIDLYQIHWPDYNNPMEPALELMAKFKQEGKIRAIGVSNFSVAQIKTAIEIADIASVQPPMNLLNRSANDIVQCCVRSGLGVLAYGALGGGILTGRIKEKPTVQGKEQRASFYNFYEEPMWTKCQELLRVLRNIAEERGVAVSEVAINWLLAQNGVTSALLGATNPRNAVENAKAAEWELSEVELNCIDGRYAEIFG